MLAYAGIAFGSLSLHKKNVSRSHAVRYFLFLFSSLLIYGHFKSLPTHTHISCNKCNMSSYRISIEFFVFFYTNHRYNSF